MLTPKENFRLGFLLRCAEEGLSSVEIQDRVKLAFPVPMPTIDVGRAIGDTAEGLSKLLGLYLKVPLLIGAGGIAAAGLGGAGLGYGAAKMTDQSVDPEDVKQQELILAYRQQAERARRNMARLQYRQKTPTAPKLFR